MVMMQLRDRNSSRCVLVIVSLPPERERERCSTVLLRFSLQVVPLFYFSHMCSRAYHQESSRPGTRTYVCLPLFSVMQLDRSNSHLYFHTAVHVRSRTNRHETHTIIVSDRYLATLGRHTLHHCMRCRLCQVASMHRDSGTGRIRAFTEMTSAAFLVPRTHSCQRAMTS